MLTQALPVLDSLRLPGTVFVVTDFVGQDRPMSWPGIDEWVGTPHEDELVSLSWEELRRVSDRVLAGAEAAGYAAVGGLPAPGVPTAGWPRVGVYPPDSLPRFRVKVARPVRRVREGRLLRRLEAQALLRGRPRTAGHERAELE